MKNLIKSPALLLSGIMVFTFSSCKKKDEKGCTDSQSLNYDAAATVDDGSCQYPFQGPKNPGFESNSDWTGGLQQTGTGFMPTSGIYYIQIINPFMSGGLSDIYQDNVCFNHSHTLTFDYGFNGLNQNGFYGNGAGYSTDSIWTATINVLFTSNGTATLWTKTVSATAPSPGGNITISSFQKLNESITLPSLPDNGRLTIETVTSVVPTMPVAGSGASSHNPSNFYLQVDNIRVQ